MATFEDIIVRVTQRGADEVGKAIGLVGKESEKATGAVAALNRVLYTMAAAFSINSIKQASDEWQSMSNQLRVVTKTAEDAAKAQESLYRTAQSSRVDLKSLVDLYASLQLSQKETRLSGDKLNKTIETISKTITLSGSSAQAGAAGLRQLVQGLQSGRLNGEELRSVLENTRYTALTLAKGLGVPVGALRKLGEEGKLTTEVVVNAFLKMQKSVDQDFAKTTVTISQGLTLINNAWLRFIGSTGEASGATTLFAKGLVLVAEYLPQIVTTLALVTAGWIAYRVAITTVAAVQAIVNLAMMANPVYLYAAAIAAVAVIFITLTGNMEGAWKAVQSLYKTMKEWATWAVQGIVDIIKFFMELDEAIQKNAVSIGTSIVDAFTKAWDYIKSWGEWVLGLITESVPNTIKSAWEAVKSFFIDLWEQIKSYAVAAFDAIVQRVQGAANSVTSFFDSAINKAKELWQAAKDAFSMSAQAAESGGSLNSLGFGGGGGGGGGGNSGSNMRYQNQNQTYKPNTNNTYNPQEEQALRQQAEQQRQKQLSDLEKSIRDVGYKGYLGFGSDAPKNSGMANPNPFIKVSGSVNTSGGPSSGFGEIDGFRAAGGPVKAGGRYIVGENGPEFFMPGKSGYILPNAGTGDMMKSGASGGNSGRTAINMMIEALESAFDPKLDRIGNTLDEIQKLLTPTASSTSSGGGAGGVNLDPTNSSLINNYGTGTIGGVAAPSTTTKHQSIPLPGGQSMPMGGGAAAAQNDNLLNWDVIRNYGKQYADLIKKSDSIPQTFGIHDEKRAQLAIQAENVLRSAPSHMVDYIKAYASQLIPTRSIGVGMRTGGSMIVGGSGGADSQFIPLKATPGERIDVRTRRQTLADDARGESSGGDVYVEINIQTQDADSFRKSEKQVAREFGQRMARIAR